MSMNGFATQQLNEDNFGESKGFSVRAFDAFPKTKQTYLEKTKNGHHFTVLVSVLCVWLTITEISRWFEGTTRHTFSVEKGVAHSLQMNLDIVLPMQCNDLHINIQDASGDRVLAGETLTKDPTNWLTWTGAKGSANRNWGRGDHGNREERAEGGWEAQQLAQYQSEEDVHDYLGAARRGKKYRKTPKVKDGVADACRIFGTVEGNKVQGDFHITARGHGYMEFGQHLDHSKFNFSHHINELSFGPFYPTLLNPLDDTAQTTPLNFQKFQYYLSVVPTVYTDSFAYLTTLSPPGTNDKKFNPAAFAPHTIFTNQYAVTEQSHEVGEWAIPGIFVKYDIEPILLTVSEEPGNIVALILRCVNVVAGVLVAGSWIVSLVDWAGDVVGRRRAARNAGVDSGLLHGKKAVD